MSDSGEYHRLLKRQIKKSGVTVSTRDNSLDVLLDLVNASYFNFDEERKLNERAEKISGEELRNINISLLEKNRFLDSFNHGLAHDAKNHTANLKGLLKMFKKYQQRDDKLKLQTISEKLENSINQMSSLLEGFLYLSSVSDDFKEGTAIIDSDYLKNSILLEIDYLLDVKQHNIQFEFNIGGLKYSQAILKIILVNLISNSLKFSSNDKANNVLASISFDVEYIYIKVSDTGVGMDLNDKNSTMFKLFDRRSNVKNIKGYGVGLYLIKNILDRNNGKIEVNSMLHEGTVISIKLPLN